ncbi:hypothetical protein K501DRAFT_288299 [Backusella circina FSU 941]|nr:hypothetical protein K501DRAFT_288299 [Backusella circina FSU 941]
MAREHKGCTSASCCSPARLWRTLQTIIKSDQKQDLISFFNDDLRREHIVRVALTSRLSNDASQLPPSHRHTVIRMKGDPFGRVMTDLNSLQLALITASEPLVLALLSQLKLHHESELGPFIHHLFGKRGHSSLELALFLKRTRVVKVLLGLGAKMENVTSSVSHKKCWELKDETTIIIPNVKQLQLQQQEEEEGSVQKVLVVESQEKKKSVALDRVTLLFSNPFVLLNKRSVENAGNDHQPIRSVWLDPLKKPPDKQNKHALFVFPLF